MADLNINKSETPFVKDYAGNNLVPNPGFESAPPFTAATTTAARWIDGTAAGSTSNDVYGWALFTATGTVSAQFDTAQFNSGTTSLKCSLGAVASSILILLPRSGTNVAPDNIVKRGIPAYASTSYILTYYMKTNLTSGSSTGAAINIAEINISNAAVANHTGTRILTTTGWTQYTVSFTTLSTCVYFDIQPQITGTAGSGTLIMDAWFDDIVLTPVSRLTGVDVPLGPLITPGIQDISGPKIWS